MKLISFSKIIDSSGTFKSFVLSMIFLSLKLFFVSIFTFLIFSCEENNPEIKEVQPSVVFSYVDENSLPENYLSVFVKTLSDNNRVESFIVKTVDNDINLKWIVKNPDRFTEGDNKYVFARRLNPIDSTVIPKCNYFVEYMDSAGKNTEIEFSVAYDSKYSSLKMADVETVFNNSPTYISLYDEYNQLIYIGKKKNDWNKKENILRDYKRACFRRDVYAIQNNRVVFLFPLVSIKSE